MPNRYAVSPASSHLIAPIPVTRFERCCQPQLHSDAAHQITNSSLRFDNTQRVMMGSISTRSDLLPCGHCAKLFNNPHDLWDLRPQAQGGYAVDVRRDSRLGLDIYKSGQSGCQICALYWSYITESDSQHRSGGWEARKYGTSVWLGWNDAAASFFYLNIGPRLTSRLTDFSMLPTDSCGFYSAVPKASAEGN